MRQVKRFAGGTPPVLKSGEWASNDFLAFLGVGEGNYRMFQGALDLQKEQTIVGFKLKNASITIPSGTPFSRLQELIDALPKVLISNKYQSNVLYFHFEDGTYVNDLNGWLQIRNLNYNMIWQAKNRITAIQQEKNVIIDMTHSIEVYGSYVRFEGMQFKYDGLGGSGAMYGYDANIDMHFCSFQPRTNCGTVSVNHHSEMSMVSCHFQMAANNTTPIASNVQYGGKLFLRDCIADPLLSPNRAVGNLRNGQVFIEGVADLHITEKSVSAGASIEVFGSTHTGSEAIV